LWIKILVSRKSNKNLIQPIKTANYKS
jgi:hypothetical protein